ncbi:unnamed protein product [Ceutorhynchus assimilis]|uniref:Uncharacterized protein n=1 Tax=Ceutorhynchus assimilis TaxID=467358 RepID=A0A9N9MCQ5_9CUCU|nr:unnamed protein product [Ceutorhynchus assimilis]
METRSRNHESDASFQFSREMCRSNCCTLAMIIKEDRCNATLKCPNVSSQQARDARRKDAEYVKKITKEPDNQAENLSY